MKFLIDMNLSPKWVGTFEEQGYKAVHWFEVGAANASDITIMEYALNQSYIVFTHDLDFGNILAATAGKGPSVIQARTNDTTPDYLSPYLFKAVHQFKKELLKGALITIIPGKMRVRILPLKSSSGKP